MCERWSSRARMSAASAQSEATPTHAFYPTRSKSNFVRAGNKWLPCTRKWLLCRHGLRDVLNKRCFALVLLGRADIHAHEPRPGASRVFSSAIMKVESVVSDDEPESAVLVPSDDDEDVSVKDETASGVPSSAEKFRGYDTPLAYSARCSPAGRRGGVPRREARRRPPRTRVPRRRRRTPASCSRET